MVARAGLTYLAISSIAIRTIGQEDVAFIH